MLFLLLMYLFSFDNKCLKMDINDSGILKAIKLGLAWTHIGKIFTKMMDLKLCQNVQLLQTNERNR